MATKKRAKSAPKSKKSGKTEATQYPKTTCGRFFLVPNGDGTAREVPVPSVTGA
jgi:hypothetical protein